jgi:polyhydroxyalkanoate synthesis repressor PhaR
VNCFSQEGGRAMNEGKNMEASGLTNNTANIMGGAVADVAQDAVARNPNVKVIKRYQNRKLYDTHQSCYVTLDEIAEMIMRGEEVVVIDNRSKRDITSSTLTQIIFEKQKRSKAIIPVSTLRDIIQLGGGTFSGFLSKSAESGSSVLNKAKADLEKSFSVAGNLRGTFLVTQRAAEDLKKALEERAQTSGLSREAISATQVQLQNLGSQLTNLEKLIEVFEARSAQSNA